MTVHSFHIFDRRGKTLFTKSYIKKAANDINDDEEEEEKLAEQRKLVFGMLFSLRELSNSLSPQKVDDVVHGPHNNNGDIQLVKTGASTLYNYETVSGLRFVLYTTPETSTMSSAALTTSSSTTLGGAGGGTSLTGTTTAIATSTGGGGGGVGIGGAVGGGSTSLTGPSPLLLSSAFSSSSHPQMTNPVVTESIRGALQHIYEHIWVTFVVRSPMFRPYDPDIASTNFEASLDNYLRGMPWFR